MTPERRIIENLKGRARGINSIAATAGVADQVAAFRALNELVAARIVIKEVKSDRGFSMAFYSYNHYRASVKPTLTVVK